MGVSQRKQMASLCVIILYSIYRLATFTSREFKMARKCYPLPTTSIYKQQKEEFLRH